MYNNDCTLFEELWGGEAAPLGTAIEAKVYSDPKHFNDTNISRLFT
jgi:hypothetical protein